MKTRYVEDKSKGTIQPGERIVFGRDTIESLEEKKRKEEIEAEKRRQH